MRRKQVHAIVLAVVFVLISTSTAMSQNNPGVESPPIYETWETFTTKDGLPDDHIYWVEVDPVNDCLWVGTDDGLGCLQDGNWKVYTPEDGLGHQAVMCVEVDTLTGDLWIGTFKGLTWFSAGRFHNFTQFNSGLANDIVYGVAVQGDTIWAATTAGTSRYIKKTREWMVYDGQNAPMHENWCYNVCNGPPGKIFVAVWGGGILEYDMKIDHWQDYRDPDGEFEIDLFPHDGLVHEIVTAPSYAEGLLWASTYFGISLYDNFRRWRSYFETDSGLASDFINFVRAKPGTHVGWICTDKGLSVFDYDLNRWVTYKRNEKDPEYRGIIEIYQGKKLVETRKTKTGIAHNFVLSVDFDGDDVWVGTSHGLSHGILNPTTLGLSK